MTKERIRIVMAEFLLVPLICASCAHAPTTNLAPPLPPATHTTKSLPFAPTLPPQLYLYITNSATWVHNTIDYKLFLTDPSWQQLMTFTNDNTTTAKVPVPGTNTQMFFRVRLTYY